MQLEQIMYQPMQIQKAMPERQRVYTAVDLEYLSAGALYSSGPLSGSGPLRFESSGPLGFGSMSIFDKMDDFVKLSRPLEPLPLKLGGSLTIRDFPSSGFQLHIHGSEGHIDEAGLKIYGEPRQFEKLTNYEAAMADLRADKLDKKKY